MTEMEKLKELQKQLEGQLSAVNALIRDLEIQDSGVSIGMIVMYRGKRHRVVAISTGHYRGPWLSGNPELKDGSYGKAVRRNVRRLEEDSMRTRTWLWLAFLMALYFGLQVGADALKTRLDLAVIRHELHEQPAADDDTDQPPPGVIPVRRN